MFQNDWERTCFSHEKERSDVFSFWENNGVIIFCLENLVWKFARFQRLFYILDSSCKG